MVNEPKRQLDTYEPSEMALPEVKLVQAVGGDYAKSLGAKPGQFFCPLDDSIVDEVDIVVVDIQTTRTYWGRDEIEDSPPDCASLDAKGMRSIAGEDCVSCSHRCDNPWMLKPQERRQMCNLSYNILGIKIDDFTPLVIRAGGISALPVRQLITQLRLNRALKGDYHRAVVHISSTKKKTSSGEAYSLHPKIIRLVTDEAKAQELNVESQRLLGAPIPLPEGRPDEEQEPVAEELAPGITLEPKAEPTREEVKKFIAEEKPKVEAPKAEKVTERPLAKKPLDLDLDI